MFLTLATNWHSAAFQFAQNETDSKLLIQRLSSAIPDKHLKEGNLIQQKPRLMMMSGSPEEPSVL